MGYMRWTVMYLAIGEKGFCLFPCSVTKLLLIPCAQVKKMTHYCSQGFEMESQTSSFINLQCKVKGNHFVSTQIEALCKSCERISWFVITTTKAGCLKLC